IPSRNMRLRITFIVDQLSSPGIVDLLYRRSRRDYSRSFLSRLSSKYHNYVTALHTFTSERSQSNFTLPKKVSIWQVYEIFQRQLNEICWCGNLMLRNINLLH